MTVEICWDYTYITAGPQMYSTIVWLGRITSYHPTMLLQSCGEPLHQTKRPKTKFWGMSLNVNLAVGLGDGGGDRQKAASCLSIVVRCGHVGWSRYKRPFKYQMLQKLVTCLPQIIMFLVNPHTLCYRISTFTETQAIFDIFAVFGLILQYFATMTLSLVEQEGIDWMQNTKGTSIYITRATGRLFRLFSTWA